MRVAFSPSNVCSVLFPSLPVSTPGAFPLYLVPVVSRRACFLGQSAKHEQFIMLQCLWMMSLLQVVLDVVVVHAVCRGVMESVTMHKSCNSYFTERSAEKGLWIACNILYIILC